MNALSRIQRISSIGLSMLEETGIKVTLSGSPVPMQEVFDPKCFLPPLIGDADLRWQNLLGLNESGVVLHSQPECIFEVAAADVKLGFMVPAIYMMADTIVGRAINGEVDITPVIQSWASMRHRWAPAILRNPYPTGA